MRNGCFSAGNDASSSPSSSSLLLILLLLLPPPSSSPSSSSPPPPPPPSPSSPSPSSSSSSSSSPTPTSFFFFFHLARARVSVLLLVSSLQRILRPSLINSVPLPLLMPPCLAADPSVHPHRRKRGPLHGRAAGVFYDQAPDVMRSMGMAMQMLSISLGSYLSGALTALVSAATSGPDSPGGWLPKVRCPHHHHQ